jgi:hypothetical protein
MSIKILPSMEHTFTLAAVKGSETAQIFEGTFTYKRPNLRTRSSIAKTAAMLNEDLKNLDEDIKFLHDVLANLKHTLIKVPQWWTDSDCGYELYDTNVVLDIYAECRKFENNWFESVWVEEKKETKKESKTVKENE